MLDPFLFLNAIDLSSMNVLTGEEFELVLPGEF